MLIAFIFDYIKVFQNFVNIWIVVFYEFYFYNFSNN